RVRGWVLPRHEGGAGAVRADQPLAPPAAAIRRVRDRVGAHAGGGRRDARRRCTRAARRRRRRRLALFEVVAQLLAADRVTELGEGLRLDLANALARHTELLANLLERSRLAVVEPEAHAHDLAL